MSCEDAAGIVLSLTFPAMLVGRLTNWIPALPLESFLGGIVVLAVIVTSVLGVACGYRRVTVAPYASFLSICFGLASLGVIGLLATVAILSRDFGPS